MNLFHRFTFENSLDDPEVEKAASRIQAGFKGHKARKEVKELKQERENQEEKIEDSKDTLVDETKPQEDIVDMDLGILKFIQSCTRM